MMKRARYLLAILPAVLLCASPGNAVEGGFVGVDLGLSIPTNPNYRAHTRTGGTGNPFGGYMFRLGPGYVGPQGELQFSFFTPDNDGRGLPRENQYTSLAGYLAGVRLELRPEDVVSLKDHIPFWDRLEMNGVFEGGGFTGLSGTLRRTAPGYSIGGGLDFYITERFTAGIFGRFNRTYQASQPEFLPNQVPEEQGPDDARWALAGIALTYRFVQAEAPAVPPPAVPPLAVKKKIILRNVNFDFDRSNIRPDAAPILDEAVRLLKDEGEITIVCAGFTDSIGTEEYNKKLSIRRAQAVKAYLVNHGIAASRITVEGFGESDPIASNATPDGRAQNRRVELRVVP
jgi:outer membrane protein OmpA-like peptidoglycan-associated protein